MVADKLLSSPFFDLSAFPFAGVVTVDIFSVLFVISVDIYSELSGVDRVAVLICIVKRRVDRYPKRALWRYALVISYPDGLSFFSLVCKEDELDQLVSGTLVFLSR